MHDKELILEILHQVQESAQKVVQRFEKVRTPNDFTDTSDGVEKMDAICMMLIVISESLKKLDKLTGNDLKV